MFLNIQHLRAITGTTFFPTPKVVPVSSAVSLSPFPDVCMVPWDIPNPMSVAQLGKERGEGIEFYVGEAEEGKTQFMLPAGTGGAISLYLHQTLH